MRRLKKMRVFAKQSAASLGAGFTLMALLSGSAQASDPIYQVDLNKTQILRLPAAAGSIVIGNPAIADVTAHSSTMLIVVGRGFGETNLIVLDRDGNIMVDADVQVTSITPTNGIRLFNGNSRRTYSCSPYCQPSPVLGDMPEHISANSAPEQRSSTAMPIFEQSSPGGLMGAAAGSLSRDMPP